MTSRADPRTPGRKRVANGASTSTRKRAAGDEPRSEKKKKSRSTFNPQPIRNDTDEEEDIDIPPPPQSVRRPKIFQRQVPSPPPLPANSSLQAQYAEGAAQYENDTDEATRAASMFRSEAPKSVPMLSFVPLKRPRPSAPLPPPSPAPERLGQSTSRRSRKSMRQSMRQSMRPGEMLFDSVVPLPVTDTPVIVRNEGIRMDAERRSSLGMRGQRGSSSFDRGEPSYPHSSVPSTQFFKHIKQDLPEPIKARWLISWCARRALDEHTGIDSSKGKQRATETSEVDKLLGDIVGAFVANVAKGNVDTNVFGTAAGDEPGGMIIHPHPRNVDNRKLLEKENTLIRRLKAEDRDWGRIAHRANTLQQTVVENLKAKDAPLPPDAVADEQASGWFQAALHLAEEAIQTAGMDIGSGGDFAEVEHEVDTLHQASHRAKQYVDQTRRFLDGIFSTLASDLRARGGDRALPPGDDDQPDTVALLASASARGERMPRADPINVLRALAVADAKHPSSESVARAAALPVAAAPRPSMAATPRRPTATPRRTGTLGRSTTSTTPR